MTCSVIDGEDVVQDVLMKAVQKLPDADDVTNPEGWLFRLAHNQSLDFLRWRGLRNRVGIQITRAPLLPAPGASDEE